MIPTIEDLRSTHQRIKPYVHHTPVLSSSYINQLTGATVLFKCENFQKVGAFKARGGFNAILSLNKNERAKGVTAHSSGNHAQAVALAAQTLKIPAFIVMPSNAPKVKRQAVEGYGAKVIMCEPTLEAREATVQNVINETGAILIHPFNDYNIIAGQGTATIELLEEKGPLDYILLPIGGGGLISGGALAAKYISPYTHIVGSEPEGADDAYRSFKARKLLQHKQKPNTIADGLLTTLGDKTFEIILKEVKDILLVSDQEIKEALKMIWQRMKIVIEPSSAVPLAALIKNKAQFENKKVGIIVSGGNVDLEALNWGE